MGAVIIDLLHFDHKTLKKLENDHNIANLIHFDHLTVN